MTTRPSISQQLERHSFVQMESSVPADLTLDEWRRLRSTRRRPAGRRSARVLAAARRVVPLRPVPCDHVHEQTSRYDPVEQVLTFLLVCPACRTEKVVETQSYEPRFKPHVAIDPSGASVHQLPIHKRPEPTRRAA